MPTTPHSPAALPPAGRGRRRPPGGAGRVGTAPPRATATISAAIMPTAWVTATTPNSGTRRLIMPPPKSPRPQAIADVSPSAPTRRPGSSSGIRHPLGPRQRDHRVGERVVPGRGGEVDHLVVGREIADDG